MVKDNLINVVIVTLFRVLTIVGQLYYVKLYTKYVIPSELGINAFLTTVSYSINAILLVPLDCFQQAKIYKYLREKISLKTILYFNRPVLIGIGATSLIILLPILFIKWNLAVVIALIISMSVTVYAVNALKGIVNNIGHIRFISTLILAEILFKISLFYLFVRVWKPNGVMLFTTAIIASALIIVILIWYVQKKKIFQNEGEIKKIGFKEIFTFSYPISIGAVLNWLQLQGYRLLLVPTGGAELVGIYSTISGIGASAMNAVSLIFNQLNTPKLYKSDGKFLGSLLLRASVISVVVLAGSYLFSDIIVLLLTKNSFLPYSKIIAFGVLTEIGNFLIGPIGLYLTIKNKTIFGIWGALIGFFAMTVVMGFLHFTHSITIYTVGLPIIISQLSVLVYYLFVRGKHAKS